MHPAITLDVPALNVEALALVGLLRRADSYVRPFGAPCNAVKAYHGRAVPQEGDQLSRCETSFIEPPEAPAAAAFAWTSPSPRALSRDRTDPSGCASKNGAKGAPLIGLSVVHRAMRDRDGASANGRERSSRRTSSRQAGGPPWRARSGRRRRRASTSAARTGRGGQTPSGSCAVGHQRPP
jgi:hypothetical protein